MAGSLRKSLAGKEDLSIQTNASATETFERLNSVGGTVELKKFPDIWGGYGKLNIAKLEIADQNYTPDYFYLARNYASINAAVTAIGSTQTTLVVTETETLTASLIIPSTLRLVILKGGSIVKASTYTLTINGTFEAGLYQVFSGFDAGDVTFGSGSVKEVKEEWFADDDKAIASYPYTGWSSLNAPVVKMFRIKNSINDGSGGIWKVFVPGGVELDTTGTTTQGLQEAINYAVRYGYDLEVEGGGIKPGNWPAPFTPGEGQDVSIIQCSTGISFPPMQKIRIRIGSATINFTGAVTGVAMNFDSCMMVDFEHRGGQIVAVTASNAVAFVPTGELPYDAAGPAITNSRFIFSAIVSGATNRGIHFDATSGPIVNSKFDFMEINEGSEGIQVSPGTHGFIENQVSCTDIHGQDIAVDVGNGATGATNIYGNIWNLQADPATGSIGVDIWGTNDIYNISVTDQEGTPAVGLKLESTATGNIINCARLNATTEIQDLSNQSNQIIRATIYVDRGDPTAPDFTEANLTTDDTWRSLDLSSIVPSGIRFVYLRLTLNDDAVQSVFRIRKSGMTNLINIFDLYTQAPNVWMTAIGKVPCVANRTVEYIGTNLAFTAINLTVVGWEY